MTTLFDPLIAGDIALANRIVMAPLTRDRAGPGQVPTPLMAEYYRQRASAGLIVTEASQVCPEGQGYLDTPGIYNAAQVAGWRRATDAVHGAGGKIVIQLWHVGRISHVSLQPGGIAPVSSTARRADAKTFTKDGFVETSTPRALRTDELPGIVGAYREAARRAIEAGFDGVEVHGANASRIGAKAAGSKGWPAASVRCFATISSTPPSCLGPITAMRWLGQVNTNRGS